MKKYVKVFIYDYENNGKEIYIPEVSEIEKLVLKVISGDEVLDIFTKDGELLHFDASSSRKSQYLEAARILHKEEDLNSWVILILIFTNGLKKHSHEREKI